MDTSEEYINMCEKAKEIQQLWKPQSGDWYLHKYSVFGEELDSKFWNKDKRQQIEILVRSTSLGEFQIVATREGQTLTMSSDDFTMRTCVWIPRQDQLAWFFGSYEYQINAIWDCLDNREEEYKKYKSMEQYWIAMVMKESYNKEWSGTEWILVKST